jgi:hypothetical protein
MRAGARFSTTLGWPWNRWDRLERSPPRVPENLNVRMERYTQLCEHLMSTAMNAVIKQIAGLEGGGSGWQKVVLKCLKTWGARHSIEHSFASTRCILI